MILEIARITVTPGREAEFEAGVEAAAPLFRGAKGCRAMSLRRSVETPETWLLMVEWDKLENHMVDFRESEAFQTWRNLVSHCFAAPPQVEHAGHPQRFF